MRGKDASCLNDYEKSEAPGVSNGDPTPVEGRRRNVFQTQSDGQHPRLAVEGIQGFRCFGEWSANAARQVSCQIVTVDHLLPKVATLRNRCRWSALRMTLGNDQAICLRVSHYLLVSSPLVGRGAERQYVRDPVNRAWLHQPGECRWPRHSGEVGNAAASPASTARPFGRRVLVGPSPGQEAVMSLGSAKIAPLCCRSGPMCGWSGRGRPRPALSLLGEASAGGPENG